MNASPRTPSAQTTCFVRAYAKINLTLDVLGRRPDGYHDLLTIMQTVDIFDTICFTAVEDKQVHLVCSVAALSTAENLALRAAQLLRQRFAIKQGVMIEIIKRIPVAAGLGGGSSDAAAVLLALRQWWQLDASPADMLEMAALLGSDVPFFLTGGLALCEGRGERVTNLTAYCPRAIRWLLLLKPALSVSTATVFKSLPTSDYTDGSHSRAVLAALGAQEALEHEYLHNSLERGVLAMYPEVALAREHMQEAGAPLIRLSGSGPTLFAPFTDLDHAMQVQERLRTQGYEVYLSHAVFPR
jgi:4-diphosphocytidyl-2-C-methyl-D-erythritol kinase